MCAVVFLWVFLVSSDIQWVPFWLVCLGWSIMRWPSQLTRLVFAWCFGVGVQFDVGYNFLFLGQCLPSIILGCLHSKVLTLFSCLCVCHVTVDNEYNCNICVGCSDSGRVADFSAGNVVFSVLKASQDFGCDWCHFPCLANFLVTYISSTSCYLVVFFHTSWYPASLGFPVMHQVHAICTQSIIAIA